MMPRADDRSASRAPALLAAALLALAAIPGGCTDGGRAPRSDGGRPTADQPSIALGNLRSASRASALEVQLAEFFFGATPSAELGLVRPVDLALSGGRLLISDSGQRRVLAFECEAAFMGVARLADAPQRPSALAVTNAGDLLVSDPAGSVVRLSAADGRLLCRYKLTQPSAPGVCGDLRPTGVACVGGEVWVSNGTAHRIEVFDAASGAHLHSFGGRGDGPGQFGLPMSIAVGAAGEVYVVDMLNARVQVFDSGGGWLRDIGGRDRGALLGRPKDVAVGPDGIVFVSDAARQAVLAFAPDGRFVATIGDARDGADALVVPAGVAISRAGVAAERTLPAEFAPAYFVLVAEQLRRPGVRVYAWRGVEMPAVGTNSPGVSSEPITNPHWHAERCATCHGAEGGAPQRIAHERVDEICVSCHDGSRASAEPHPVGWPAAGPRTHAPEGWPLVGGRIGCVTCHDFAEHCSAHPVRPSQNANFVRGWNARNPVSSCTPCHEGAAFRVDPHAVAGPGLRDPTDACGFCHVTTPRRDGDGRWSFDARLRDSTSGLCLNCHAAHPDPAPNGHLGAAATTEILKRVEQRDAELRSRLAAAPLDRTNVGVLPFRDGRVECYSCHNPHAVAPLPTELFVDPAHWLRSTAPGDEHKALRLPHAKLCQYCHLD